MLARTDLYYDGCRKMIFHLQYSPHSLFSPQPSTEGKNPPFYLSIHHLHHVFIINMNYEFIILLLLLKLCHIRPLKASLWVSMSLRHASISFLLILIILTQDVLGLYLLWTSHGVIYSSVDSWLPLVVLEINLGALGMLTVIKVSLLKEPFSEQY